MYSTVSSSDALMEASYQPNNTGWFSAEFLDPSKFIAVIFLYEQLFTLQRVANLSDFLQIAQLCNKHDTIGQDLVAICVNDLLVQGAEPLFFHGHFAFGKLDAGVAHLTQAISDGIAEACKLAGCTFLGTSTFKSVFKLLP